MIDELKEFRELADMKHGWRQGRGVPEPPDEAAIKRCIQVMMARQCIYPDMHHLGPSYRVLSTPEYQGFFRRYFAAMGLEFHHDTRSGMVALRVPEGAPRYDHQGGRLKKDETAVLLALRIAYEEAFREKRFDDGAAVDTTTDEIFDRLGVIGGVGIEAGRLREILDFLRRKGVVELGERDPVEHVIPVTILPGIEVVVPSTWVERVRMAAEAVPDAPAAADASAADGEGWSGNGAAGGGSDGDGVDPKERGGSDPAGADEEGI